MATRRVVLLFLVVTSCGAPAPPVATPPPGSPTSAVAPEPSDAGRPAEPVLPTEWVRQPASANLAGGSIHEVVPFSGGYAAIGSTAAPVDTEPVVWLSDDGVGWAHAIRLPMRDDERGGSALSISEGAGGFVVGGNVRNAEEIHAAFWHSPDGDAWERVGVGDDFANATVAALTPVGPGFAAVGSGAFTEASGFRAWASPDGRTWHDATPIGQDEAFATDLHVGTDGTLHAWGPTCSVCVSETAWWSSRDGERWAAEGVAPGLEGVSVGDIAATDAGLTALGATQDAADGLLLGVWHRPASQSAWTAAPAPGLPPDSQLERILAVGDGFLAGGTRRGDPRWSTIVVALPPDAEAWVEVAEFADLHFLELVRHGVDPRLFVVIGRSGANADGPHVTWVGSSGSAP